jgi:hypothetical protein
VKKNLLSLGSTACVNGVVQCPRVASGDSSPQKNQLLLRQVDIPQPGKVCRCEGVPLPAVCAAAAPGGRPPPTFLSLRTAALPACTEELPLR